MLGMLAIVALIIAVGVAPAAGQACTANELATLLPSDHSAGDMLGVGVALDGDTAVIGAYGDDVNGSWSGSAYVFVWDGRNWVQQAKLLPSDGSEEDYFGGGNPGVAISGDTVVVGAHGNANAAYVFQKPAGGWVDMTETAKLTPADGVIGDGFGTSVGIDGDTVVIGAAYDDDNGESSGSAYVFERPAGGWVDTTQTAKLLPSDGFAQAFFGTSVAIVAGHDAGSR